jgi:hypothetical protein
MIYLLKKPLQSIMVSPPASLETQSTQSKILFSLSGERPESEKHQPFGQNKADMFQRDHNSKFRIPNISRNDWRCSLAALFYPLEKALVNRPVSHPNCHLPPSTKGDRGGFFTHLARNFTNAADTI